MCVFVSLNVICLPLLKEGIGFQGLELQAIVSRATWALGTELWENRSTPNY